MSPSQQVPVLKTLIVTSYPLFFGATQTFMPYYRHTFEYLLNLVLLGKNCVYTSKLRLSFEIQLRSSSIMALVATNTMGVRRRGGVLFHAAKDSANLPVDTCFAALFMQIGIFVVVVVLGAPKGFTGHLSKDV